MPVGSSKDCICTSSSLTTPPVPSLVIEALVWLPLPVGDEAAPAYAVGRPDMPPHPWAARNGSCAAGTDAQAAAGHGDRVDFLDETDRAALAPRRLAQRLEVGADLAGGGAVVHRLERGGRDEQERHAGLPRHRLGQVGLSRARRAFEEQPAARGSAHLPAENLVGEEEVDRADHVLLDALDADDVIDADVDLLGAIQHVRRAAGAHRGAEGHREHHREEHDDGDEEGVHGRQADPHHRVAGEDAEPQVGRRAAEHQGHDAQPAQPGLFACPADVRGTRVEHYRDR